MHDAMQAKIDRLMKVATETAKGAHELLVPISGGSDSAFVFWLLNQVFPQKVLGVHGIIPAGYRQFGQTAIEPWLREEGWFHALGKVIITYMRDVQEAVAEESRWSRFLAMSLARKAWLVGSRNRTEDELGTYSMASRSATYLPIVGVWKSDVMRLCEYVGVPKTIIASSYRADPNCGRPKELAEIPFHLIELFIQAKVQRTNPDGLTPEQIAYLDGVYDYNRFKKSLPLRGPEL